VTGCQPVPRYSFSDFILSPRRRTLLLRGRERPLIPRYFDLLVFLVERRHEAVHRREIFDGVWKDAIVSDSALSQAVRTLRRTLGDDSREPRFIRTVSRHGYRFVYPDVVEEVDDEALPETGIAPDRPLSQAVPAADPFEPLLRRVTDLARSAVQEEEQRDAAERLHALGTSEALQRLGTRPRHAFARALLRDTRWDVAEAGAVPILGAPGAIAAATALVRMRLTRARTVAATRVAGASLGGGLAGVVAGAIGGLMLVAAPGSAAPIAVAAVLALIGGCCGALGGGGVAAGISVAEAASRSQRMASVAGGAAAGGGFVGLGVQWFARWTLSALVGVQVEIGGGLEGLSLGAAAGLAYGLSTAGVDWGLPAPRGRRRLAAAAAVAAACSVAALALTLAGRPLVGGTIHLIAEASRGSQAMLTPLGQLIGETDFGPITRAVIGTGEGTLFGFGLALGLTRRPRWSRTSHRMLTPR